MYIYIYVYIRTYVWAGGIQVRRGGSLLGMYVKCTFDTHSMHKTTLMCTHTHVLRSTWVSSCAHACMHNSHAQRRNCTHQRHIHMSLHTYTHILT